MYSVVDGYFCVMRGLLEQVLDVLGNVEVVDNRLLVPLGYEPEFKVDFELWKEQGEAVSAGVEA
jgi:hypothetical protein